MVKRIDKLTKEQEARFPEWIDKWVNIGLQTGEMDLPRFTKGIKVAYEKADITWHGNIVIVKNPLIGAFASPIADYLLNGVAVHDAVGGAVYGAVSGAVHDSVRGAVSGAVRDAVRVAVGVAVGDAVDDAVYGAVSGAVGDAVDDAVYGAVSGAVGVAVGGAVYGAVSGAGGGAVHDAVRGAVGDAVNGAVRNAVDVDVRDTVRGIVDGAVDNAVHGAVHDAVRVAVRDAVNVAAGVAVGLAVRGAVGDAKTKELKKHITANYYKWLGGQFWVGGWYWGNAYVTFFRDVCNLELSKDIQERMEAYEDINSSSCYSWPNKQFVMVCERPTYIKRDEQGRLHSEIGSSIKWDGFELYHWHGVAIPKEWVTGQKPSPKDALMWPNIEQRRAACELVGWKNILDMLDAKVIDKDDDPEIGTLLECDIPDSGKELFLSVKCATGRDFALIVTNSQAKTALDAQAWIFQLDKFVVPEVTA